MPSLSPAELAARRHSAKAYVDAVVRRAGELTPDDLEKIRGLLPPTADETDEE